MKEGKERLATALVLNRNPVKPHQEWAIATQQRTDA